MSAIGSAASSFLQTIGEIPESIKRFTGNYRTKSLIDVTQVARVEPLTVISEDCLNLDCLSDVLQSTLNVFTGYYLQAMALSSKVNNVKVVRALDRLNPDRHFNDLMITNESLVSSLTVATEAYRFRLPTSLNKKATQAEVSRMVREPARRSIATELLSATGKMHVEDPATMDLDADGASTDKSFISKTAIEVSNMAVGKLINVDICIEDKTITIPVSIRLSTTRMRNDSIMHILALKKDDNTLVERFHAWRSGRIGLIKDLIFCQDLIDEHKKALMHDEDGTYSEIVRRVNSAKLYGVLSSNPSLVSASNLFIFSEAVAKELEVKMGGKLSNPHTREKVFQNTYAMILIVIDREWDIVTFYHRGIAQSTVVSTKDLKSAAKDKGQDISDFLKAYSMGNAPQF